MCDGVTHCQDSSDEEEEECQVMGKYNFSSKAAIQLGPAQWSLHSKYMW